VILILAQRSLRLMKERKQLMLDHGSYKRRLKPSMKQKFFQKEKICRNSSMIPHISPLLKVGISGLSQQLILNTWP